ncbi:MAG: tRNA(Met) cytidine acetate ligase [Eubacteriaceae bacterium]
MKTFGIIAEYNPFHLGHALQISETKASLNAEGCLVLMSGSVTQRGNFAFLNKWERTKLALLGGADLVCELPYVYSGQTAEIFASGGIKILNSTNVCDYLSFGSESGQLANLEKIANLLAREPFKFKLLLKEFLSTGISFPKARELAIGNLLGSSLGELLNSPNNILGIEYLKALIKTKSTIKPHTVKRQGADYHSLESSTIPSASGLRHFITTSKNKNSLSQWLENKIPYPPDVLIKALADQNSQGEQLFYNALKFEILGTSASSFKNYPYVSEGIENKIYKALKKETTLDECIEACCSKRIPKTRIQRILTNRLINLNTEDLGLFSTSNDTPYLRVLGFNKTGQKILGDIKKNGNITLLSNLSRYLNSITPFQKKILHYDIRSADLLNLFNEFNYQYHRDYTQSPIIQN